MDDKRKDPPDPKRSPKRNHTQQQQIHNVPTDDWCLIELLVIDSTTWNHLTLLTYAKLNC